MIHRQAAVAVGKLLAADATRSGGANVKALTLAPHIAEKKATYAVTCNTLRCKFAQQVHFKPCGMWAIQGNIRKLTEAEGWHCLCTGCNELTKWYHYILLSILVVPIDEIVEGGTASKVLRVTWCLLMQTSHS